MIRLSVLERLVNAIVKALIRLTCRVDASELRKIPRTGALILITNHTTNIEAPAVYVLLQPRRATALGKIELWENPVTRFLMNVWKVIPVHRGRVDSAAIKSCVAALNEGSLLGVAPEGTRSATGSLTRGGRGAAMLALRTGVPVYPTSQLGFRDIGRNLKRLRRTVVTIRVGRPFFVKVPAGVSASAAVLRDIADAMMFQIAQLLPDRFRGEYAGPDKVSTAYLEFAPAPGGA